MGKEKTKIRIGSKLVGENCQVLIIAEAGINHNGNINLAKKMIDEAVGAGADVIKFQTFFSQEEVVDSAPKAEYQKTKDNDKESYLDMIRKLEFVEKDWRVLMDYCRQKGIIFLSTPSEEKSARLLEKLSVPAFKIGSSDIKTIPMLEEIASFGKPVILSSGMSTMADIRQALDCISNKGNNNVIVLHCTTSYPCPLNEVNLSVMKTIQRELGVLVGYSDHTKGFETPVIAVALGACVIEKHFTLDRNLPGPDHKMSMEPLEFKQMVKKIRQVEKMNSVEKDKLIKKIKQYKQIMGSSEKKITESEARLETLCRKSIVARKDIKKGETLTRINVAFKRPALGLSPDAFKNIVGRRLVVDLSKNEFIKFADLTKKIVYVTGSRAEYGVMSSLLHKINKSNMFDLSILVTGMHLNTKFGNTINDIKNDGFKISGIVDMKIGDNTNSGMAISLGLAITGLTNQLVKIKPDIVLVAGDRGEAFAAAIVAAHLNIPIAHISGGDTTTGATIDEKIRHAITQISDFHFPANKKSADKIVSMLGEKRQVFLVGNPGIFTTIIDKNIKKQISKKYNLDLRKPFLIVLQHPVTTQTSNSRDQMIETMSAIEALSIPTIVIYPNSDAGSKDIIEVINEYRNLKNIQVYKHIIREDFLNLLALGGILVGNSSSALIEAPSYRVPAINIGNRQEGRLQGSNVVNVGYDRNQIIKAIRKVINIDFKKNLNGQNPYVLPNSEEKIIKILRCLDDYQINEKKD